MKKYIAVLILILGSAAFAADLEDQETLDAEIDTPVTTETTETKKVETKTLAAKPKKKSAPKEEKADVTKDDSGDTYNFYFQKGSGPGSVEQGGGQQKVGPQQGTSTARPVEEDDQVSNFEGHLGLVVMPASSGSGLSVGGQFNFSRKWGLQVHLLQLTGETGGGKSSSFSFENGSEDKETKISSFGGSVAAVYTPVTFNERRMPVRFGLLGGVMVLSTTREETIHTFWGMNGSNDSTSSSKSSKLVPFAGVSATAKLGKQFGLVGYGKIASDSDYSQIGLSAAWLF